MKAKISWPTIVSRGILFSAIWWILTDGVTQSWWIGVPAVLIAVIVSVVLLPIGNLVWFELLRFAPSFFMRSLLGGADVAWRAFHPSMPIAPDFIEYPLRLPPGLPQVSMANTVSLLPGTLSAELSENSLKVHVLDVRKDFLSELMAVEQSIARMFGTSLKAAAREESRTPRPFGIEGLVR
jgi:multicomponent Na+:H+ antiporter subunit E